MWYFCWAEVVTELSRQGGFHLQSWVRGGEKEVGTYSCPLLVFPLTVLRISDHCTATLHPLSPVINSSSITLFIFWFIAFLLNILRTVSVLFTAYPGHLQQCRAWDKGLITVCWVNEDRIHNKKQGTLAVPWNSAWSHCLSLSDTLSSCFLSHYGKGRGLRLTWIKT